MDTLKDMSEFIDGLDIPLEEEHVIEYPLDDCNSLRYYYEEDQFYIYMIDLEEGEEHYNLIEKDFAEPICVGQYVISPDEFEEFKAFIAEQLNYLNKE